MFRYQAIKNKPIPFVYGHFEDLFGIFNVLFDILNIGFVIHVHYDKPEIILPVRAGEIKLSEFLHYYLSKHPC